MEWLDISKQAMYNEKEKTWVQPITWRIHHRTVHAEVLYPYETHTFEVSTPYVDNGLFEPVTEEKDNQMRLCLLTDEAYLAFLTTRKTIFDALECLLLADDWQITKVTTLKETNFSKEIRFSVGDNLQFTAYLEKQVDWSLNTLTAQVGTHTLYHAFHDTNVEKKVEAQLFSHIFS